MKKAFSLLETLVVVAITAVLFALVSPVVANAKESARQRTCASNLKQDHLALTLYSNNAGNLGPCGLSLLPASFTLDALNAYGLSGAQRICPDSSVRPPSSSYMWQILAVGRTDLAGPDLNAVAEGERSSFRAVVCLTHDAAFFAPREQNVDLTFQKAFSISLLADGSVRSERGRFARLPLP